MDVLAVFVGAGLGGVLRHLLNLLSLRLWPFGFPIATLFINISGSLIMGFVVDWLALRGGAPQMLRLFATTGILGGYTTFSTFSLEAGLLWKSGRTLEAVLYVVTSVGLSLLGLAAGMLLARRLA